MTDMTAGWVQKTTGRTAPGIRLTAAFSVACIVAMTVASLPGLAADYTLALSVTPPGSGSIDVEPNLSGSYPGNTQVTVTARPATDFEFVRWLGFGTDIFTPGVAFVISADMSLTAVFQRVPEEMSGPLPGTYDVGQLLSIQWDLHDDSVTLVNIELSLNGGDDYTVTVAAGLPNSLQRYDWLAPRDYDGQSRLRLRVIDASGIQAPRMAEMSAPFAIMDSGAPDIILRSPQSGDTVSAGASEPIQWEYRSAQAGDFIRIEYSSDGMMSWRTIVEKTPVTAGAYLWSVPPDTTSAGFIRLSTDSSPSRTDVNLSGFQVADAVDTDLAVDCTQFYFTYFTGGASPAHRTLIVSNAYFDTCFGWETIIPPTGNPFEPVVTPDYSTNIGGASVAMVDLAVTGYGALAVGVYDAVFSVRRVDDASDSATINMRLTVCAPRIELSVTALDFEYVIGDTPPAARGINLSTTQPGIGRWTATVDDAGAAGFLSLSPSNVFLPVTADTSRSLSVSISETALTGLTPGVYSADFTVVNSDDAANTISVPVTLTVRYPRLDISASNVVFQYYNDGVVPDAYRIVLSTTDAGNIAWTLSDTDEGAFLDVASTDAGNLVTVSGSAVVTVSVKPDVLAGLSATVIYPASFAIVNMSGTHADWQTTTIHVTLTLFAGDLGTGATSMAFEYSQDAGAVPSDKILMVTNAGPGKLDWSLSLTAPGDGGFLKLPAAPDDHGVIDSGGSAGVSVGVDVTGLSAGVYHAAFIVKNDNDPDDAAVLNVQLAVVSGPPVVAANTARLTFYQILGTAPDTLSFIMTNAGKSASTVTITSSVDFYNISPASFSLAAGETKTVTVTSDTLSQLVPGVYGGYLYWTASGTQTGAGEIEAVTVITQVPLTDDSPGDKKANCALRAGRTMPFRGADIVMSVFGILALGFFRRRFHAGVCPD